MTTAVKDRNSTCGVCKKKEIECNKDGKETKCSICGVELCFDCKCEITRTRPGQDVLGVTTSPLQSGQKKTILCPVCLDRVDPAEL